MYNVGMEPEQITTSDVDSNGDPFDDMWETREADADESLEDDYSENDHE